MLANCFPHIFIFPQDFSLSRRQLYVIIPEPMRIRCKDVDCGVQFSFCTLPPPCRAKKIPPRRHYSKECVIYQAFTLGKKTNRKSRLASKCHSELFNASDEAFPHLQDEVCPHAVAHPMASELWRVLFSIDDGLMRKSRISASLVFCRVL